MKRFAVMPVVLGLLAFASPVLAQAGKAAKAAPAAKKDAVPATAPAAPSPELMKARMRPALKGTAYIEIIRSNAKVVGKELHDTTRVKNVSTAPIVGLRIDEYYYAGQKEVAVGTGKLRAPLAPGEIAEITTAAQVATGITNSQLMFTHANGQVKPTAVKKFTEDKK